MRHILILFLIYSQYSQSNTIIYGTAFGYKNAYVHVSVIDDYLTNTETELHQTTVDSDGRFLLELDNIGIREIVIRINNSYAQLFIQNDATYYIQFPDESIDVIEYFSGSETEILFFDLDTSDINYKVLGFEAWMDDEIANLYIIKDVQPIKFVEDLIELKKEIQKVYSLDTCTYFKNYIKYSLGKNLDNIQYFGSPTKQSKYDFFIKYEPIQYDNPAYMEYINDFYDQYFFQLSPVIRKPIVESIYNVNRQNLLSAIEFDTLIPNQMFAELIALKIIQQEYNSDRLPKNNLIAMTDQIRLFSDYIENRKIASNLIDEFYSVISGDPLPKIFLTEGQELKSNQKKHLYIHVFDPNNPHSLSETSALRRLYEKYNNHIQFVSIYLNKTSIITDFSNRLLKSIPWDVYPLEYTHPFWKSLDINSFPSYILVDPNQIILSLPALGPSPNGVYETIEKTFYNLQKK